MNKAILLCLGLSWIGAGHCAELRSAEAREITCKEGAEFLAPGGKLVNNMWNKQAAGKNPFKQCLLSKPSGETEQHGWSWSWPAASNTVLAFPQVVFGWKPWNGGSTTTPKLPIRIDVMRTLKLNYNIDTTAKGKYVLSAALWFTRTGETGPKPNPRDISADVNIWTEVVGFSPSGVRIATISIDDNAFELWHQPSMGDASGANSNQWSHIVFRAESPSRVASLDLKKFIAAAVQHELLTPTHFVSSIELGNEVIAGSGESWIRTLSLQVE